MAKSKDPTTTFFSLPGELRNQIYELAVVDCIASIPAKYYPDELSWPWPPPFTPARDPTAPVGQWRPHFGQTERDVQQSRPIVIIWAPILKSINKLGLTSKQVRREVLSMDWQFGSFAVLGKVRDRRRVCGYQRIVRERDGMGVPRRNNVVLNKDEQVLALRFDLSVVLELKRNIEDEGKRMSFKAEPKDAWKTTSEWSRN